MEISARLVQYAIFAARARWGWSIGSDGGLRGTGRHVMLSATLCAGVALLIAAVGTCGLAGGVMASALPLIALLLALAEGRDRLLSGWAAARVRVTQFLARTAGPELNLARSLALVRRSVLVKSGVDRADRAASCAADAIRARTGVSHASLLPARVQTALGVAG